MIVDLGFQEMSRLIHNRDQLYKVVDEAYEVKTKIKNLFYINFRCSNLRSKPESDHYLMNNQLIMTLKIIAIKTA